MKDDEIGTSVFMKCGRCGRANNTDVEFYYHHRWEQNLCEHCFKIESKGD